MGKRSYSVLKLFKKISNEKIIYTKFGNSHCNKYHSTKNTYHGTGTYMKLNKNKK
jgi:hypothetical protein